MAGLHTGDVPSRPDQPRPEPGQILIVIRKSAAVVLHLSVWHVGVSTSLTCFASESAQSILIESPTDDFSARSSDELSLSKGDRVELIERDDDFGDGWYLGRHLTNGTSGLFPEGGIVKPILRGQY